MTMNQTYQPEYVVIRKDWLYQARECLQYGMEAIMEELAKHDSAIGRDRPRGKRDAEEMEARIKNCEVAMRLLNDFVYSHSGENTH